MEGGIYYFNMSNPNGSRIYMSLQACLLKPGSYLQKKTIKNKDKSTTL